MRLLIFLFGFNDWFVNESAYVAFLGIIVSEISSSSIISFSLLLCVTANLFIDLGSEAFWKAVS